MSIYAFSSFALNYLSKARVAARTLKLHHPEIQMHALVAEPIPESLRGEFKEFDRVHSMFEFGGDFPESWIFRHTLAELCTAIKPDYQQYLMSLPDCEAVIYIDPDIALFSRMESVLAGLNSSSIILTPHLLDPETSERAIRENEQHMLRYGTFNLGFLATKNSPEGRKFTAWWRDRVRHLCFDSVDEGVYMDQLWIDMVPSFFEEYLVLRDRGVNVATWNIAHRPITGSMQNGYKVNGEPLVAFHFSGIDRGAQLAMLDTYAFDQPAAYELRDWYISEFKAFERTSGEEPRWVFGEYSNGEPVLPRHRREYRAHRVLQIDYPRPFLVSESGDSYFHWCRRNLETQSGLSAKALHERRFESTPGVTLLEEFLKIPPGLRPSATPEFDADFYLSKYPDVARSGLSPFEHFVRYGAAEGREGRGTKLTDS